MKISQFLERLNKSWQKIDKITNFLVFLAIFFLAVQFCFPPALAAEPVTINILVYARGAALLKPYMEEFHKTHPDIEVNVIEGPHATNLVEDLYTSSFLLGNSPYDLVYIDPVWMPKFAAAGWLLDLSDRLSAKEMSEFVSIELEAGKYQGKLYRVPFLSSCAMVFYRKDLLEKAGYEPPETFEQLIEISQAVQKQGLVNWGYVWQGKQYEGLSAMFVEVLQGYGAFWIDPQTLEVGLDRPEAIEAVKFLRTTIDTEVSPPGVTTYQEDETRRLFQSGQVLFLRNWSYVYNLASQPDSPIRGKFDIKPMVSVPGKNSASCAGGWGLAIAKSSKHPDEAWQVIQFLTSLDIQRQYILETGYVPSLVSLFTDPQIVAKYNYYPQLLEVIKNGVLRPSIAQYAQASDILQRYLSAAITNKMSPKRAMKAAANETRRLLKTSE